LAVVGQAGEALDIVRLINASEPQLTYYDEVFEAATKGGKADQAIAVVRTIPYDQPRSRAFSAVASALASAGEYRRALAVADNCNFSSDKLAACTAILLDYAAKRRPALKSVIEKSGSAQADP
jgi:hypothetical protein